MSDQPKRIHILGASGSGTTTLAAHLSKQLSIKHLDTDEYYWKQTPIRFSEKHSIEDRLASIRAEIGDPQDQHNQWVLSGSLCSWGDPLIKHFTHVVFLWIPWEIRKQRLLDRESSRYPPEDLQAGGSMHQIHTDFIEWASRYDTAGLEQRSRATHEAWLDRLPNHIKQIRLEGEYSLQELGTAVVGS